MPELPEVETIRRQLAAEIAGIRWQRLSPRPSSFFRSSPRLFAENLSGARLDRIERYGKLLLLRFAGEWIMLVHLGMSGQVLLSPPAGAASSHRHLRAELEDGRELAFRDPRRFGYIRLVRASELAKIKEVAGQGRDPLAPSFTWAHFISLLERRNVAMKALLMDQRLMPGVGNIYSDEILHRARIAPFRRAIDVGGVEMKELYHSIRDVLAKALEHGGTSFDDAFVDIYGRPGLFGGCLRVYGKAGEPCGSCHTPLKPQRLGGRASVYCPRCQK
jgi:formamidopyrimidine-DNA glycosylase